MNFTDANALLVGRYKHSKKLGNNTYLVRNDDGSVAVKLHDTNVVTMKEDGTIILDSGGWRTNTTKERMNHYMPSGYDISQRKSIWYLIHRTYNAKNGWKTVAEMTFKDGCGINPNGTIFGGLSAIGEKKQAKLTADVKEYAKRFINALEKGKVGLPSTGDCWYCSMTTAEDGKTLGDSTNDNTHILAHIKENYFVPSLLVNACNERGVSRIAMHNIYSMMQLKNMTGCISWDAVKSQVQSAITKYVSTRLGLTV